ncbi:hypothetical protein Tmel_0613 [Thermosipho melanesiensis BI429]|uniref:TNase-like domain-containing protein n=1 Tax=Thermosipho melanesiensis (strain DSM 12029 / CIP 104789 / BI429) TaxID=391009 RepID=A6LKM6_THEM4|nr:thermonuclease family protein [Thermosipho melanesiensis]ABR30477.1 hypothetical protein Tmel_0613 [Thermosipho melanesiensis BI429]
MKKLFVLFFAFVLLLTSCVNLEIVTTVIDGDTFYTANEEKVRIVGIDTPEIHSGSKPIGEFGEEAKIFWKTS